MAPPWTVFPTYARGALGWRMGDGEDYIARFAHWFRCLGEDERAAFVGAHPEPNDWTGYFGDILGNPGRTQ